MIRKHQIVTDADCVSGRRSERARGGMRDKINGQRFRVHVNVGPCGVFEFNVKEALADDIRPCMDSVVNPTFEFHYLFGQARLQGHHSMIRQMKPYAVCACVVWFHESPVMSSTRPRLASSVA